MATSLMKRAAHGLASLQNTNKKLRERMAEDQTKGFIAVGGGTTLGTGIAAVIDEKWGGDSESQVAEFGESGVPVTPVVGAALALGCAFAPKFPGRMVLGGAGIGMFNASLYHMLRNKISFGG